MTSPGPIHLAVALDGAGWHPAAWREPHSKPRELTSPRYWTELVSAAESAALDFVTIEDSLTVPGDALQQSEPRTDRVRLRLDAQLIAARVAPRTANIGLIPTITTAHTEPFHVSTAVATLDYTSHGRAGWQVKVSGGPAEAGHFGRRAAPEFSADDRAALHEGRLPEYYEQLFDDAVDHVDVVRRLWDSWEDDAEIRDVVARRFIDRDKVHHIDFVGKHFSVRGPSITPRPPQGQPIVAVLAHQRVPYELAARGGDLVFVTPADDVQARLILDDVRAAESAVKRAGTPLQVYADLVVFLDNDAETGVDRVRRLNDADGAEFVSDAAVFAGSAEDLADQLLAWKALGYDGFRLRPGVALDDLEAIRSTLVPELQRRGVFRTEYTESTLRQTLGLPASVPNRYAAQQA
ncbi:LLM class flavin-dependent oxidoreductase [Rhodococcoides kyotonense]|uniref:Flavin-dependent oxidoreductase, luciferase family (Includes alkanesulfonate monooxygenase SsuD and methylene tetrahydromethanopterin reductase) n=1 Tax=Rhodococcoides kyotonense TaxID=398843 RepID=A0A239IXH8_9NOCA|nr:LLM class flavin-dependent oxidoreductase [Rhodococcus kyotonensis]SNS98321.1 Flavin-dependent oxidoreductase, luciferase family (includes alkanesulfonate monooxygenase SsuD and methylene tetrahydromethanopterin reductase) [Rhodococcus kyotonensis]